MKRYAIFPALLLAALASAVGTTGGESAREAWRYQAGGQDGWFRKEAGKQWVEAATDGGRYDFEELARTPQYVELFDRGRTIWLRLYADHVDFRQGQKAAWGRLYDGRWVKAADLPRLAEPDHRIRLVYFVPADRQPTADYAAKIRTLMHFVAELYRQDFTARGIDSPGLRFEGKDGVPVVHLVRGRHDAAFYTGAPNYDPQNQWRHIPPELPRTIGVPNRNVLIVFAETYDEGPAPFEWPGGVALGGRLSTDGGLGLFSAWILRPEFCAATVARQKEMLFDATPIRGRTALGHGGKDSPRFEFIEDGFGAVAHELGHALGLPHDNRRDDLYIMGNGFRNLRRNFEPRPDPKRRVGFSDDNARILYSSRYLAPDAVLSDRVPPKVQLRWAGPLQAGATTVRLAVDASDDQGLRAVLFYAAAQDSTVGGRALTGKAQAFEQALTVRPLRAGPYRIEAFVTDVGGNLTRVELHGTVEK